MIRACECTFNKFLASKCSRDKCVFRGDVAKAGTQGVFYGVTATSYSYWRTAEGSDWYDKQSEKKIVYSFYISVENLSEIFIYL